MTGRATRVASVYFNDLLYAGLLDRDEIEQALIAFDGPGVPIVPPKLQTPLNFPYPGRDTGTAEIVARVLHPSRGRERNRT